MDGVLWGKGEPMDELISRKAAIKIIKNYCENGCDIAEDNWCPSCQREQFIKLLEALQPEYEPVKAEDFARTMSENTHYSFMAWYGEALELMRSQGFVICKKMM